MKLPKSIKELAGVIGNEKALFLISQLPTCYSGVPGKQSNRVILYVPTLDRLKPDHHLVQILGWLDAAKLCKTFGGEILQPANCSGIYQEFRDKNIKRLQSEGVPVAMISEWFGISERHIRNLMRAGQENPQEDLRLSANDNRFCH